MPAFLKSIITAVVSVLTAVTGIFGMSAPEQQIPSISPEATPRVSQATAEEQDVSVNCAARETRPCYERQTGKEIIWLQPQGGSGAFEGCERSASKSERGEASKKTVLCPNERLQYCFDGKSKVYIKRFEGDCVEPAPPTAASEAIPSTTSLAPVPLSQQKAEPSPTPTKVLQKDLPQDILGLWKFKNMEMRSRSSNGTAWSSLGLSRIPQSLRYVEFTQDGVCSEYRNVPEGGMDGFYCVKRARVSVENSGTIYFFTPFKFVAGPPTFVVNIATLQASGALSNPLLDNPTEWRVNANVAEFIAHNENPRADIRYTFTKLIPPDAPDGPFTLRVDSPVVGKGEDMVLTGSVRTTEPVRIYIKKSDDAIVETFSRRSFDLCGTPACNSPPLFLAGEFIPPIPQTGPTPGVQPYFEFDGPHDDCPWYTTLNDYHPYGVTEHTDVLCVRPDANGLFKVKIFNPGTEWDADKDGPVALTVYAKLHKSGKTATVPVSWDTEIGQCYPRPPGDTTFGKRNCPPNSNRYRRTVEPPPVPNMTVDQQRNIPVMFNDYAIAIAVDFGFCYPLTKNFQLEHGYVTLSIKGPSGSDCIMEYSSPIDFAGGAKPMTCSIPKNSAILALGKGYSSLNLGNIADGCK